MARPLWKDLRAAREQRSLTPITTWTNVPLPPRPRFGVAIVAFLVALAAIGLDQAENGSLLHSASLHQRVWAGVTALAFFVFGCTAVRRFATQIGRLVHVGGGPTAGAALRLILTIAGIILVIIVTIGMLGVSPTKLATAAGVTGIILGLAGQQSLGNVFAGIVLMVARPFSVGQRIRIRSGSYGGTLDGDVLAMGLTYVDLDTDEGLVRVPNLGLLAAAVGPAPPVKRQAAEKSLYVNRSVPKRPPRQAAAQHVRRLHREPTVRTPREIIKQMRERRGGQARDETADPPDEKGSEG